MATLKESKESPTDSYEDGQLRAHVLWSPHREDEFVYASSDLRLYQALGDVEPIPRNIALSKHMEEARFFLPRSHEATKTSRFNLVYTVGLSKQEYYPCLTWGMEAAQPHLLVAGLHTGQALLLQMSAQDPVVKEFGNPGRHNARRCNAVAWNPRNVAQFATGLERSDRSASSACVFLWDVNQSATQPRARDFNSQATESVSDAVCQFSSNDSCKSLAWKPDQPNCLMVGTRAKTIKFFDVLSKTPITQVICHLKSILGIKFDPFQPHRFATFSDDGTIKVWDHRQMRNVGLVVDIPVTGVTQIEWSTTRPGMLASCSPREPYLRLWDVEDDGKAVRTEKVGCRLRDTSGPLGAFAWHPVHTQRLLTATTSGELGDFYLFDAAPISFAVDNSFALGLNETVSVHNPAIHVTLEVLEHDISTIMRRRALCGYSLNSQKNTTCLQQIPHFTLSEIEKAWKWLHDGTGTPDTTALSGISALLTQGTSSTPMRFSDSLLGCFKVYTSAARTRAIRLCGWWQVLSPSATPSADPSSPFDIVTEKANYENFLRNLEAMGLYEKAAALALFHLDLDRALTSLSRGTDSNKHLGFIALALSGYSYSLQAGKSLDKEKWKSLHNSSLQTLSPYLQAAFAFFCEPPEGAVSANELYRNILFCEMELTERMAFACRYLSDSELNTFLVECTTLGKTTGNLETLVLTGLANEGLDVLQSYVNRTADIQTTALLACYSTAYFPSLDRQVSRWVEDYCGLLNAWKLWTTRAKFDVSRAALCAQVEAKRLQESKAGGEETKERKEKPQQEEVACTLGPQVYVRCNYCGQSLSKTDMGDAKPQAKLGRVQKRIALFTTRIRGCPACKHPLPRCALCLEPFDCATPAPDAGKRHGTTEVSTWDNGSMQPFNKWFTWCLGCRHGGHANHIAQWFATHAECPVVDCVCHCNNIDVLTRGQRLRVPGTHQSPPRRRGSVHSTPQIAPLYPPSNSNPLKLTPSPSLSAIAAPLAPHRASTMTLSSLTSNTSIANLAQSGATTPSSSSGSSAASAAVSAATAAASAATAASAAAAAVAALAGSGSTSALANLVREAEEAPGSPRATASWSSGSTSDSPSPEQAPLTIHGPALQPLSLPASSSYSAESDLMTYSDTIKSFQQLQQQQQDLATQMDQRARVALQAEAKAAQDKRMRETASFRRKLASTSSSHLSSSSPNSPRLTGMSPPRSSSKGLMMLGEPGTSAPPTSSLFIGSFHGNSGDPQARSVSETSHLKVDERVWGDERDK